MSDKQHSLVLDTYYNQDKEALLFLLRRFISPSVPSIPLEAIFEIIEDSDDIDYHSICLEIVFMHKEKYADSLFSKLHSTRSQNIISFICGAIGVEPSVRELIHLIPLFFNDIEFRPIIRDTVFHDKKTLLLSLAYFVEDHPVSKEQEQLVIELLKTIPRDVFLSTKGSLSTLKLYDYYYQIPPQERHPKDTD